MPDTDPRVDAYIAKSADFARPILTHLRKVVHEAAPEIQETIKWRMPHFDYKGMVCGMAAFKEHCAFGFWKEKLVFEGEKVPVNGESAAMGTFKRNAKAKTALENFSPSQRREYVQWLTEAKRPETRAKRLAQAIKWMAEGKPRNWKYMNR
jgi:uncharacterized protein YdeI (YjbR/CyaY-like superfamily)